MRRALLAAVIAALFIAFPEAKQGNFAGFSRIDDVVKEAMAARATPGAVVVVGKGDQTLYGACKETDKDGDYTSTTFDSKAHHFIGGTGKYKGITGDAPFTVETLPAPGENRGALIIPHEVTWKLE